jgi:hypothetical protein
MPSIARWICLSARAARRDCRIFCCGNARMRSSLQRPDVALVVRSWHSPSDLTQRHHKDKGTSRSEALSAANVKGTANGSVVTIADALRTSVVAGNYLQINSPWRPARTRGFPLYSHRCCLGHLAETPSAFGSSRQEAKMPRLKRICQRPGSIHKLSGQNALTRT